MNPTLTWGLGALVATSTALASTAHATTCLDAIMALKGVSQAILTTKDKDGPRGETAGVAPGLVQTFTCTPAENEKYIDVGYRDNANGKVESIGGKYANHWNDSVSGEDEGLAQQLPDGAVTCVGNENTTQTQILNPSTIQQSGINAYTRIPMCRSSEGNPVTVTIATVPSLIVRTGGNCKVCGRDGHIIEPSGPPHIGLSDDTAGGFSLGAKSLANLDPVAANMYMTGQPNERCTLTAPTNAVDWGTVARDDLSVPATLTKHVAITLTCDYEGRDGGTVPNKVRDLFVLSSTYGLATNADGRRIIASQDPALGFDATLSLNGGAAVCNADAMLVTRNCVISLGNWDVMNGIRPTNQIPTTANTTVSGTYDLAITPNWTSKYAASRPPIGGINAGVTLQHWYGY